MAKEFTIKWVPTNELESILPLVGILNNGKISEEKLQERLKEMVPRGYKCIGAYDGEALIGICGVWELVKFYAGKHVEPDNVVILPEYRSHGLGKLMMDFLFQYAQNLGYEGAEVNCYAANLKGKKFWETHGYEPLGLHMIKRF